MPEESAVHWIERGGGGCCGWHGWHGWPRCHGFRLRAASAVGGNSCASRSGRCCLAVSNRSRSFRQAAAQTAAATATSTMMDGEKKRPLGATGASAGHGGSETVTVAAAGEPIADDSSGMQARTSIATPLQLTCPEPPPDHRPRGPRPLKGSPRSRSPPPLRPVLPACIHQYRWAGLPNAPRSPIRLSSKGKVLSGWAGCADLRDSCPNSRIEA